MTFCRDGGVDSVLIGLRLVGVVGLHDALARAEASGHTAREGLLDVIVGDLSSRNYIPESVIETYRDAMWRELLRHRGEDIRHLYTPLEVAVRGGTPEDRASLVRSLTSVLAEYELRPALRDEPSGDEGSGPRLLIDDEVVVSGTPGRTALKRAIHKRISHW